MNTMNRWWADLPNERFWLVVTRMDEVKDVLVVPEEDRNDVASWVSSLPAQLTTRDVLFHYDPSIQAIVAWSRARSPAARQEPGWSLLGTLEKTGRSLRAKWVIKLRRPKPLDTPLSIDQIARAQWDLFPALRALEDRVGDPLYYPFAMGNPDETHTLPGRIFKLPAVFVERFPSLAAVAHETRVSGPVRSPRRAASWWAALESLLEDRPRAARAR